MKARIAPIFAILLSCSPLSLQAGKIYDWDFTTMSAVDSVNGVTATLGNAGGLSGAGYTMIDDTDQGITVVQPANVAVSGTYTIEIVFSLDNNDVNYQRIIDFHDYLDDEGLYAYDNYFYFYDYYSTDIDNVTYNAAEELTLVISRSATSKRVYVTLNGVRVWGFIDSGNFGVFNETDNVMHFFQDDDNGAENPEGGVVKSIRVYNKPLTDPVELAAVSKKCKKLKKAFKKAKKTKIKRKIAKARKKYKKCKAEETLLRSRLSMSSL